MIWDPTLDAWHNARRRPGRPQKRWTDDITEHFNQQNGKRHYDHNTAMTTDDDQNSTTFTTYAEHEDDNNNNNDDDTAEKGDQAEETEDRRQDHTYSQDSGGEDTRSLWTYI